MPQIKKSSRAGRPPSGEVAKKVVSLTIDPALIEQLDVYAADKGISRSGAVEAAIVGLLTVNSPIATAENNFGNCIFASPSLGAAIHY
jgi:metal-responsive CopG/Arc/MetJ family transcriptional regulator